MNIDELYKQAVFHRDSHDCSAYPYQEYKKLIDIIKQHQPKQILEIGTGMGFTAVVMASLDNEILIDSVEKDVEHVQIAKEFIENNKLTNQINILTGNAEKILFDIQKEYDLIFFDGYQVHYEFLPHYERLLKPQGILVLANNHLKSKTSDQFFEELEAPGKWRILEKFADTTVAQKV